MELTSHQNIVDGNVYKLDKESDETHDQKSHSGSPSNHRKFLSIWFGAFLDQMDRVFGELLERFNQNLLESFLFHG